MSETVGVDAQFGLVACWEYYKTQHDRNGIDNNGLLAYARVHYGSKYNNAFWWVWGCECADPPRGTRGEERSSGMRLSVLASAPRYGPSPHVRLAHHCCDHSLQGRHLHDLRRRRRHDVQPLRGHGRERPRADARVSQQRTAKLSCV